MAKSRAQRKAERRRREQLEAAREAQARTDEAQAQHDTQVPESADVIEAELAEQGADLDALRGGSEAPPAPAPSRADVGRAPGPTGTGEAAGKPLSRRERRREDRERKRKAKESERRRQPKDAKAAPERRRRGGVLAFLSQVVAELRRVQWPDRAHLIQASAVTLVFIAVLAAYLGALDLVFNWFVQQLL